MKTQSALDLSGLSEHGEGSSSLTWWGTLGFMLIEGAGFSLAVAVYLFLMGISSTWPPNGKLPDLFPGTLLTVFLLASLLPNILVARWAKSRQIVRVRVGLLVMSLMGVAPLVPRAFEFAAMNVMWDDSAYGSITWVLLGLHSAHIVTDLVDTLVLACLMFTKHGDTPKRFGDVEDNALYWNFVVATWIPIYLCLYWVPRL